jgi:hypothetical protein
MNPGEEELYELAVKAEFQIRKITANGWSDNPNAFVTAIVLSALEKAYSLGFDNAPTK